MLRCIGLLWISHYICPIHRPYNSLSNATNKSHNKSISSQQLFSNQYAYTCISTLSIHRFITRFSYVFISSVFQKSISIWKEIMYVWAYAYVCECVRMHTCVCFFVRLFEERTRINVKKCMMCTHIHTHTFRVWHIVNAQILCTLNFVFIFHHCSTFICYFISFHFGCRSTAHSWPHRVLLCFMRCCCWFCVPRNRKDSL